MSSVGVTDDVYEIYCEKYDKNIFASKPEFTSALLRYAFKHYEDVIRTLDATEGEATLPTNHEEMQLLELKEAIRIVLEVMGYSGREFETISGINDGEKLRLLFVMLLMDFSSREIVSITEVMPEAENLKLLVESKLRTKYTDYNAVMDKALIMVSDLKKSYKERVEAQADAITLLREKYNEMDVANAQLCIDKYVAESRYKELESYYKGANNEKEQLAERSIWGRLMFYIVQARRKSKERVLLDYFKTHVETNDKYNTEQKDYLMKCIHEGVSRKAFVAMCDPSIEARYMKDYRGHYEKD